MESDATISKILSLSKLKNEYIHNINVADTLFQKHAH